MTQPIWYDHSEAGAPVLNNVAGSLLEVLRACLVNGFGAKTVTSISVSAGVATATSAAHGFTDKFGKLVLIAGATEPLLNGRKQPLSVSTNSFTFAAPGVADGTYTGSISARRAPLGWTEAYSGTNVAMFKASDPAATGILLRINDSHANGSTATAARCVAAESASDIDTFLNLMPTAAQLSGGGFINKGANNANAKAWHVIGSDRFIFVYTEIGSAAGTFHMSYFGDLISLYPADAYGCVLAAAGADPNGGFASTESGQIRAYSILSFGSSSCYVMRSRAHVVGAVRTSLCGPGGGSEVGSAGTTDLTQVPIVMPVFMAEQDVSANHPIRGAIPGMAAPFAQLPYSSGQVVQTTDGLNYLAVRTRTVGAQGCVMVCLSQGWH